MRIFVPATLAAVAAAREAGEFAPAPVEAFAVTGALRENFADGDEEELALVATEAAAWRSLVLIATAPSGTQDARRIVLTADVPDSGVRAVGPDAPGATDGAVVVSVPVPLETVVSVLADGAWLAPTIAAAVPAVAAGRTPDDLADVAALRADAGLAALDEVLASPLLWFDAAELPYLF